MKYDFKAIQNVCLLCLTSPLKIMISSFQWDKLEGSSYISETYMKFTAQTSNFHESTFLFFDPHIMQCILMLRGDTARHTMYATVTTYRSANSYSSPDYIRPTVFIYHIGYHSYITHILKTPSSAISSVYTIANPGHRYTSMSWRWSADSPD